jgi:predicted DNA-binding transcriptional regulator AlpA
VCHLLRNYTRNAQHSTLAGKSEFERSRERHGGRTDRHSTCGAESFVLEVLPVALIVMQYPLHRENETNILKTRIRQFLARTLRPHKPGGISQNGLSGGLEEVTFLRLPGVKAITGLSKTSLYALIREKSFPAPVRLGVRTVAWVRSEVREWAIERVRASR